MRGKILQSKPFYLLIEVNGIGYGVTVRWKLTSKLKKKISVKFFFLPGCFIRRISEIFWIYLGR